MPNLNGRISKLEDSTIAKQDMTPTQEELDTLVGVYSTRLDQVMSSIAPDVLEAIDTALRLYDAPLVSDECIRAYVTQLGVRYCHFLPGPGCRTVTYSWDIDASGVHGAYLWVLADILSHGVAMQIITPDAMQGNLVLTGSSGAWLSEYAAQQVRYPISRIIERMAETA